MKRIDFVERFKDIEKEQERYEGYKRVLEAINNVMRWELEKAHDIDDVAIADLTPDDFNDCDWGEYNNYKGMYEAYKAVYTFIEKQVEKI